MVIIIFLIFIVSLNVDNNGGFCTLLPLRVNMAL